MSGLSSYERDTYYRDDPRDRDIREDMEAQREAEIHGEDVSLPEVMRRERVGMMRHYDRVRADRIAQVLSVENIPGPWAPEMYE